MSPQEKRHADPPGRGWLSSDTLRMVALAIAFWLTLQLLWIVRSIVIIGFLGILFGIVLGSATDRLERLKIPRALGASLLLVTILGALIWTGIALAPTIRTQFEELRTRIPDAVRRVERTLGISVEELSNGVLQNGGAAASEGGQAAPSAGAPTAEAEGEARESAASENAAGETSAPASSGSGGALQQFLMRNAGEFGRILFPVASATASLLTGVAILLFAILFYAISPRFYFHGMLSFIPESRRESAREIFHEMADALRQWVIARLIAMVVIGVVVAIALSIIGVRAAILLGLIAFFLELIPFFGPILAAIPAIGMALVDSPQKALIVLILFVVIEQLEGNLLTPLLLENRVDVPPLVTVLAVPAFALVFGIVGAVIAEPVMAAGQVVVRRLWLEDRAGTTDAAG